MEVSRKVLIAKNIMQQLEDSIEAIAFEGKICSKIDDQKGLEVVKKRMAEVEQRIEAARQIIAEMEAVPEEAK